ncbi:MAG: response regulator [Alphaproteobacteria bacterium]|nr:response regulator [Alphaproteobacteria bacterium]
MRAAANAEPIVDRQIDEYRSDLKDRVAAMAGLLDSSAAGNEPTHEVVVALRRQARELKALGSMSGFPMVGMIAHRLEDYLTEMRDLTQEDHRDVGRFVSLLQSAIGRGINPEENEMGQLARSLPMRRDGMRPPAVPESNVEILLVTTSNVVRMLVERDLKQRGYRVVIARTPFEAFELAYRMKPDLLLVSNTMHGLGGADLVRAFGAMSSTRTMAAAVLTSMDAEHVDLRDLTPRVPVVRLGRYFPGDFGRVAERYQLG